MVRWLIGRAAICAAATALAALSAAVAAIGAPVTNAQGGRLELRPGGALLPLGSIGSGPVPVGLKLTAKIRVREGFGSPPPISSISWALSPRFGINTEGLPACRLGGLLGRSEREGLRACGDASVGNGEIVIHPEFREQIELSVVDRVVAFNGVYRGRRAIFVDHFPGESRIENPYVIVFTVRRSAGPSQYSLTAKIPPSLKPVRHTSIPSFELTLHREFRFQGKWHSYLVATCPSAVAAPFTLAEAAFDFEAMPHPYFEFEEGISLSGPIRGACPRAGSPASSVGA